MEDGVLAGLTKGPGVLHEHLPQLVAALEWVTAALDLIAIRLSRSGRSSSPAAKGPKSTSACGIAGMIGNRPSAGWIPACWKAYQLTAPAST